MRILTSRNFIACFIASAIGAAPPCLGDSITLKSSVRLNNAAGAITLGEIAELEGSAAAAFADLQIVEIVDSSAVMEISVRDVRARLDEAGVHWGKIDLSGRSVVVRPSRSAAAMPPLAMAPVSIGAPNDVRLPAMPKRDDQLAANILSLPTLRGTIANLITSNLQIDPHDLRLSFDAADAPLLDLLVSTTRFEVHPHSSFASDRIELTIRTWSDGRVQQSKGVSVLPQRRVKAAALLHDVPKDHTLTDADVVEAELWLTPSQAIQCVSRIAAIGRVTGKSMKVGETLRASSTRRETLVKRGELVIVRCLVGGAVISLQAEARADGCEGETIEFRKQGERDTFLATVTAPSEATIDLGRR